MTGKNMAEFPETHQLIPIIIFPIILFPTLLLTSSSLKERLQGRLRYSAGGNPRNMESWIFWFRVNGCDLSANLQNIL